MSCTDKFLLYHVVRLRDYIIYIYVHKLCE
uniref:Uncharacterized protein n=1 Tax=Setaria italica TaxID=4555 RepID=K3XTP7_SETIT